MPRRPASRKGNATRRLDDTIARLQAKPAVRDPECYLCPTCDAAPFRPCNNALGIILTTPHAER